MNEAEYIADRLDREIDWYDTKSQRSQWWYKALRIVEIMSAASIPFLVGYIRNCCWNIEAVVGILGVLIAVIAAVTGLFQFQENWVQYRTTCESLRHEKYLFQTKTEPYNVDNSFPLLVQRVESMISKENTAWSQYIHPQKKSNA